MIRLRHIALSLLIGCLLLFVPLLRDLHIESAVLASVAGSIIACLNAARGDRGNDLRRLAGLVAAVSAAALPLLVFALVTGCYSFHGLGFWVFYPPFSILFGYSLTRFFRVSGYQRPGLFGLASVLLVGIGVFLIEFFTLPQVYFHNHVWGGWAGPIYDEDVRLGTSVIFFRSITLSWAILLWVLPDWQTSRVSLFLAAAMALNLMFSYSRLAENGVISPREFIQRELGAHLMTPHFDLYYDRNAYSDADIRMIAAWHEFHLAEITDALQVDVDNYTGKPGNRIESYLYAHPWQKQKLTGAKYTSYVPVWQHTDQMHIAKQSVGPSLRHELVHVVAKQFGNRLFNASWSIGLVEGLAVALDVRSSGIATTDQLVAAATPWPDARDMRSAFSITGFYGGRSAVNYTTAGSFVSWLLYTYPPDMLREAYRTGRIKHCYGKQMEDLVAGWHEYLANVEFDDMQREAAEALFAVPSIFEKKCPHLVTPAYRSYDTYLLHLAGGDTTSALLHLDEAIRLQPANDRLWSERALHLMMAGRYNEVYEAGLSTYGNHAPLRLQQADALMLDGRIPEAEARIRKVIGDTSATAVRAFAAAERRLDTADWSWRLRAVNQSRSLTPEMVLEAGNEAALLWFRQLLARGDYGRILASTDTIGRLVFSPAFTDVFLDLAALLAVHDLADASFALIDHIDAAMINEVQRNRVDMVRRFIEFTTHFEATIP
jgi:tetratricopeptide (TPR) repeat protein